MSSVFNLFYFNEFLNVGLDRILFYLTCSLTNSSTHEENERKSFIINFTSDVSSYTKETPNIDLKLNKQKKNIIILFYSKGRPR